MRKLFEKFFLNEKIILLVILLNAVIIFLEEFNIKNEALYIMDIACTVIFVIEMIVKHMKLGIKGYWSTGWNILDGTLVILSIPSLLSLITTIEFDLSILLILRLFRVLRFFRVIHFFPNFTYLIKAFKMAMKESYAILLAFFVIIVMVGLINCALFKEVSPTYFSNPLSSIYTIFQLCTVEGWYEIPNSVAEASSPVMAHIVRIYFCLLLILGGIIGMSFINSIFVDAMVSDNNDDVKAKLTEIEKKIDKLIEKQE